MIVKMMKMFVRKVDLISMIKEVIWMMMIKKDGSHERFFDVIENNLISLS